jgi:hypothetical protein
MDDPISRAASQLQFLNTHIGLCRPDEGEGFFFDPTPGFYGWISQGTTQALNQALRILANHIAVRQVPLIEPWQGSNRPLTIREHDWSAPSSPPAMIRYSTNDRSRIQVDITNMHSPFLMGAILAHELTHQFLRERGIRCADPQDNERTADSACVFLGLAKLLLNGYGTHQWSVRRGASAVTYRYRLGYLTQREVAEVCSQVCRLRSLPVSCLETNLTEQAKALLRLTHAESLLYEPFPGRSNRSSYPLTRLRTLIRRITRRSWASGGQ